jgi:hypothetical protein
MLRRPRCNCSGPVRVSSVSSRLCRGWQLALQQRPIGHRLTQLSAYSSIALVSSRRVTGSHGPCVDGSGLSRISSTLQRRSWRPDVLRDVEADGCRSLHVVLLRIVVTSSATTSVALTRRVEEPSTASGAVILSLMRRPRIETEKSDVRGTSPFRRVQAGSCVLPLPRSG